MGTLDKRYVAATLAVAAIGFLAPILVRSEYFNLAAYLLASNLVGLELLDVGIRVWFGRRSAGGARPREPELFEQRMKPYAIVMSVHNLESRLETFYESFGRFQRRAWLIDDCSTDSTAAHLQAAGWRCHAADVNRKKPGAIKALLKRLPAEIETIVVFDPDCTPLETFGSEPSDLEAAVRRFQSSGAAACCPRIQIKEDGLLSTFQTLECEFAFRLGRKGMSPHSVTSGVAIYERQALEAALYEHSLSVYAEDLENSLILLGKGRSIYYEEQLIVETDGKRHLSEWISQRVGWSFGLIKVLAERHQEVLRVAKLSPWSFYNFAIYMGLLMVVAFPVKLIGMLILSLSFVNGLDNLLALDVIPNTSLTDPMYFATTYVCYTFLVGALFALLRPRLRVTSMLVALPFFLFYPIVHSVPIAIGYANWIVFRLSGRRVYCDHFMSAPEFEERRARTADTTS